MFVVRSHVCALSSCACLSCGLAVCSVLSLLLLLLLLLLSLLLLLVVAVVAVVVVVVADLAAGCFAGPGGKYLFHRIGWKGRTWQLCLAVRIDT